MVHITIDTKKDSKETIKHVISLLQQELTAPMGAQDLLDDQEPSFVEESVTREEVAQESTPVQNNPFAMFDDSASTSQSESTDSVSTKQDEDDDSQVYIDRDGAIPMVTKIKNKPRHSAGIVNLDGFEQRSESKECEDSALFAKQVKSGTKSISSKKSSSPFYDLEFYD